MQTERINHTVIEHSLARGAVTVLLGPRRVGKTFFITEYAQKHPDYSWVFFTMDNLKEQIRIQQNELESMIIESVKYHIGEKEKIWVVIDEAQKCPEVFDQVKMLYDQHKDRDKIKFILTGSAMLNLHQLSAESLAGRVELNYLYPFSLRESTRFNEKSLPFTSLFDALLIDPEKQLPKIIHTLRPFKSLLTHHLSNQLIWGGFPEMLSIENEQDKIIYLQNYVQTYLEKDVRAIETITDLPLYRRLIEMSAETTGSLRDDERMIKSLGCTRDTLKKYRGYLEVTLLFTELYPYIDSSLKRLVKSPKAYLQNNGLISILTGLINLTLLEKTGLIGHRLENWFLTELLTWKARTPLFRDIYFWRTSSGTEIDFVVDIKPHIFPFEITYGKLPLLKKIRSLKTFLKEEPKAEWGYYIYQGEFNIDKENKIIFLPCWAMG